MNAAERRVPRVKVAVSPAIHHLTTVHLPEILENQGEKVKAEGGGEGIDVVGLIHLLEVT